MIPKIIHYCWFGGNPLPELAQKCIASWEKYCPDYEIKEWNESNFDVNCCDYVKEAYKAKKWAFVSDYARLDVVYRNGGIYLDIDVELVKSLDELLNEKCFLGEETTTELINTGLGFGAEKGSTVLKELLNEYRGNQFKISDGKYDLTPCPKRNTAPLKKLGYVFSDINIWNNKNVTVYPPEYFCPMDYKTKGLNLTKNTFSIHHYSALWIPNDKKEMEQRVEEMKKKNNAFLAFFMRQKIRYEFYKSKGEVNSLFGYILKRVSSRIGK